MSQPPIYSKRDVDYRKGELPEVCRNCIHFIQGTGFGPFTSHSCEIVQGHIKEEDTCNLWTPNEETEEKED